MALITCDNITLGYESGPVIKNLSFSIDEGSYLSIVGENGAGKSTLIKALLGLKAPSSGSIEYNGIQSEAIGYLPQQTEVQRDFPASVKEIVLSGCLGKKGFSPFYTKEDKRLAEHNMEIMGISSISKKCYKELSGGQQQRVLLARALCATKKMILLDEPVSGLDPHAAADMYDVIKHLNQFHKITVIMVSHDIPAALEYSSHILQIKKDGSFFCQTSEYQEQGKGF